jgi:hypothetical protein
VFCDQKYCKSFNINTNCFLQLLYNINLYNKEKGGLQIQGGKFSLSG